jgi:nucleotide-binding universal stress UspA family protein
VNIRRILCPIDFSDASTHAIDHAVAFASWCKARITALHVYSTSLVPIPGVDLSGQGEATDDTGVETLRTRIASHCKAARTAGIDLDIVIESGQPASHILERAASLPADLIVMGTHGTSGFQHLVLGSVTERVLRKASCAVLTVPPRAQGTSRLPFRRLLCAVDFSDSSLTALQYAFSLARESDAELTILHVIEWPWREPPSPSTNDLPPAQALALAEYRRYCEQSATTRLKSLGPEAVSATRPPVTRISHGKPYVETLRVAADDSADLIVIGVHGRNPLDLHVFGSTANQLVRRATCPVLTVRG